MAVALLLAIAVIAAIIISADDKKEYPIVSANEGLLGTASFDVADTEHSGTWIKGSAFAIDKGDKILLKIVGEMEMKGNDPMGVGINTALDQEYAHPSFIIVGAYSDWEQKRGVPKLSANRYGFDIGFSYLAEEKAIGGGTFVVDFESTERFDRSEGKIDFIVGAGSYFYKGIWYKHPANEVVTIHFSNNN